MLRYDVYITLAHPYIIYISLVVLKANEILFLLKDFRWCYGRVVNSIDFLVAG